MDTDQYQDELNATFDDSWLNLTNSSQELDDNEYVSYANRPETYIVPVVFAIIFVVGVVGNGTLIVVFLRHRAMRNVPNTYILSLALADLLVILTCVPFISLVYTVESWPWGEATCIISETTKDISIGVSVFTLTALSADRFFAIVDPLRKMHTAGCGRRATRFTIIAATLIWILAILCAIPAAMNTYVRIIEINPTTHIEVCYPFPDDEYAKLMVLLRFLVYYAVPLALIAGFYALMARHLVLSAKNVPGELRGAQRQVRARKKVAVTVLAFVFIFAVCFLPNHVYMMLFYYSNTFHEYYNTFWHVFRIVGFCLTFMNSCVNPVALYCVSGTFRKYFNRYLLCKNNSSRDTSIVRRSTVVSQSTSRRNYSSRNSQRRNMATSIRRGGAETSVTMLGNGNSPITYNNNVLCSEM